MAQFNHNIVQTNASDLLDVNMQSISNELSALLVGHEHELAYPTAINWQQSDWPTFHSRQLAETAVMSEPQNPSVSTYIRSDFQTNQYVSNTPPWSIRQPVGKPITSSVVSTSPPAKVNFQYLRSFNRKNSSTDAVPLISVAATQSQGNLCGNSVIGNSFGAIHRQHKSFGRYRDCAPKEEIDYDKIVIDLSLIGLNADGRERNAIVRLFGCFRALHYFLNDVIPSPYPMQTNEDVSLMHSVRAFMPATMNVQQQVKQAVRSCGMFIAKMERILQANKLLDRELFQTCERSLNGLRQVLNHLEFYKHIDLEHKRGQFVSEEACAQAERLELLLQQLSEHVRETHLNLHIFNWAMERKYNPSTPQQLLQQQQQLQVAVCQQQAPQNDIWNLLAEITQANETEAKEQEKNTMVEAGLTAVDIEGEREPLRFVG